MNATQRTGRILLIGLAALGMVQASDYTGIYTRIDKVVLEPNGDSPDRIQVWGVFSIASSKDRSSYDAPARGCLYFKLDANPQIARAEWNDLKQVAGTKQIVAFGIRTQLPRLRKPGDKVENPDPYATNVGIVKVNGRTDYDPVRALLNYPD